VGEAIEKAINSCDGEESLAIFSSAQATMSAVETPPASKRSRVRSLLSSMTTWGLDMLSKKLRARRTDCSRASNQFLCRMENGFTRCTAAIPSDSSQKL